VITTPNMTAVMIRASNMGGKRWAALRSP